MPSLADCGFKGSVVSSPSGVPGRAELWLITKTICFLSVIERLSLPNSRVLKRLRIGNQIELTAIDFARLRSELKNLSLEVEGAYPSAL